MPGSFGHLVTRFFDFITAKPLDESERATVESWLSEAEQAIFFSQDVRDQAHGYESALIVLSSDPADNDVVRAALLHDVGKRHANLGAIGRSVASVLIKLHLPLTRRMAIYRDHGAIGARDLENADVSELISTFAFHHHGERPHGIPSGVWELLKNADQPAKPSVRPQRPIT